MCQGGNLQEFMEDFSINLQSSCHIFDGRRECSSCQVSAFKDRKSCQGKKKFSGTVESFAWMTPGDRCCKALRA